MAIRDEFLVTRQGKTFVLYAGLLDEAHRLGLLGIRTSLLQIPNAENGHTAIAKATVLMASHTTSMTHPAVAEYDGIGDANPDNVGRMILPHIIRMAETRAKARALRDAVNVGVAALEELGDASDDDHPAPPARNGQVHEAPPSSPAAKAPTASQAETARQASSDPAGLPLNPTQIANWVRNIGGTTTLVNLDRMLKTIDDLRSEGRVSDADYNTLVARYNERAAQLKASGLR